MAGIWWRQGRIVRCGSMTGIGGNVSGLWRRARMCFTLWASRGERNRCWPRPVGMAASICTPGSPTGSVPDTHYLFNPKSAGKCRQAL
jgi:hypothetical protein